MFASSWFDHECICKDRVVSQDNLSPQFDPRSASGERQIEQSAFLRNDQLIHLFVPTMLRHLVLVPLWGVDVMEVMGCDLRHT